MTTDNEIISPKEKSIASKALNVFLFLAFIPILLVIVFFYLLWGAILCIAVWLTWKKRDVLFVYSDSPTWKDYIEREILPHLRDRVVILNWSERKNWKNSLAVLAFRYFGGIRNFNPIGIVFRPLHLVKTHRFFEAFKDFKHGDFKEVEKIKEELFGILRISRAQSEIL